MLYDFFAQHLSYPVLFLWSILEGEVGLTLGGLLSKEGVLEFRYVVLIAICGAFLGDLIVFTTGKLAGKRFKNYFQNKQSEIEQIEESFKRYGSWLIFFERYLYGAHIPTLLIIGSSGYGFAKFLLLDIVAVSLWAVTFVSLGYWFDKEFIALLGLISKYLTAFVFLVLFVIIVKKMLRKNS
jgi:membrane protein DedA with SNARE-associated domain